MSSGTSECRCCLSGCSVGWGGGHSERQNRRQYDYAGARLRGAAAPQPQKPAARATSGLLIRQHHRSTCANDAKSEAAVVSRVISA